MQAGRVAEARMRADREAAKRRCKQNGRRQVRMQAGRAAASTSAGTASGRERVEDLAAGPLAPAVGDLGHAR